MKTAIRTICPMFNTNRMVQEYATRFYIPCAIRRAALRADGRKRSLALTAWKQKVRQCWSRVHFTNVESGPREKLPYGSVLQVSAELSLDVLKPEQVEVELYYGDVNRSGQILKGKTVTMECTKTLGNNLYRFEGGIPCDKTGQQGFMVRVIPKHADVAAKHETTLITWG